MANYNRNTLLVLLLGLVQLSLSRTVPHAHTQCPEHSYVAGVSLSPNSADSEISSIRFYCTRPSVLSEFNKHGFIQYDVQQADPSIEKKWTEPWFCQRGIATGLQVVESSEENPIKFRLICSDKSAPDAEEATWSDLTKCSAEQAICGIHALVDGTTGPLNSISTQCCNIPHPASTCKTSDIWKVVGECTNDEAEVLKTCAYDTMHGINYAGKDNERSIYEDLGFDLASAGPILATKPEFQLKTASYDWSNSSDITWSIESKIQETMSAQPGFKTKVSQIIGYCGFYKVSTPFFKTETGEVIKHKPLHNVIHSSEQLKQTQLKRSEKWDDTEGMQADMSDDSWEDSEEVEAPVVPDSKKPQPPAEEHHKEPAQDDSDDDWSDETEAEPVLTAEAKPDSHKTQPPAEEHHKEASQEDSDNDWSDETEAEPVPTAEAKSDSDKTQPQAKEHHKEAAQEDSNDDWSDETEAEPVPTVEAKPDSDKTQLPAEEHHEKAAEDDSDDDWSDETEAEPVPTVEAKPEEKPVQPSEPIFEAKSDEDWDDESSEEKTEATPVPETKPAVEPTAEVEWNDSEEKAEVVAESKIAEAAVVPESTHHDKKESDEWGDSSEEESVAVAEPEPTVAESSAGIPVSDAKLSSFESDEDSAEAKPVPVAVTEAKSIEPEAETILGNHEAKEDDSWETEGSDALAAPVSETKVHPEEVPHEPVSFSAALKKAESEEADDWNSFDEHAHEDEIHAKVDSSEVELIEPQGSVFPASEKLQVEPKSKTIEHEDNELMAKDVPEDSWESEESIEVAALPPAAALPPVAAPVPIEESKPDVKSEEETEDIWESDEKLDAGSSNVEATQEFRVPILPGNSDTVDSSKQTFGLLREAKAPSNSASNQGSIFDLGDITDKMKNMADQVHAGASDLADQIQAGSSDFIDETKKVFNEVKEMPIVQDIGKNIEDSMKKSLGSANGVDLSPKPVEEAKADMKVDEVPSAKAAGDEVPVRKAGGYIGYIVGGMVICVIVVVIAIFVIEKRQSPTPEQPKINKRDYAETNPVPEPLLTGARDRKITIEEEKEEA